ncbi:MAG TPA: glycosyl hydrolase family 18 protein [Syntrophomonadaceae bacterium]|nr:glycosyl hydrolase family 18 protein [Syntrophomonadaceae bacterium]
MLVKKRSIIILLLFSIILSFLYTYPASAGTPESYISQIKINGTTTTLNPPAFISDGRTLVPVRFIVESSALQGQVYWDESQQKVAMDCRGHYIELFIGRTQAKVDGRALTLDVAPTTWRDRTYIPLRFLVENLGGQINWNDNTGAININFGAAPRVFAYYYYSPMAEMQANSKLFSDIAFRWFETNGSGDLAYEYKDDYTAKIQWAHQQGIAAHASVMLMDKNELHQLLASSTNRWHLIQQLVSTASKSNYDGVNIDFEFIPSKDSAYFTQFLRDLKDSLGEKTLSVAVLARTGNENWSIGTDYKAVGEIADLVIIMAYDYSYVDTAPGPVAPLWWVQQVSQYTVSKIPREKILLGLATYGYDWSGSGNGKTVTSATLKQIQKTYKVQEHFDQKSMSPYYTYYDNQGRYHQIWMENQQSLTAKWNLCVDQSLGGIAFWRIGTGFTDLYKLLAAQAKS